MYHFIQNEQNLNKNGSFQKQILFVKMAKCQPSNTAGEQLLHSLSFMFSGIVLMFPDFSLHSVSVITTKEYINLVVKSIAYKNHVISFIKNSRKVMKLGYFTGYLIRFL